MVETQPNYRSFVKDNASVNSAAKTLTVECSVCCAESSTTLFKFGTSLFPINISICDQCGFIFQNPRVSEPDWNDYYETGIYDKFHRPRSVKGQKSVNDIGPITYKRVCDFISHTSDEQQNSSIFNKIDNKVKICEVGAGHGDIITSFKGGELFAIEPSENCREALKKKGLTVIGKSINSINKNITFDIILMRHVLEHIYYPKKLLDDIIPFLSDNGILYIAIPNILIPNYLNNFIYPHISYFSKYCLTYLCQSAGLEVCGIQEEEDEIWCTLKKNMKTDKAGSRQDRDSKKLWEENIKATKNTFRAVNNYPLLLKRTTMRIISHIMPLGLLTSIYERRNKIAE